MPDWEIVGKKKKEIKLTRKEKKKEEQEFINTAPKLEELLPHSQVVSLYANLTSTNAKNAKPNKPVNKENEKKNQKKLGEKKKKASHSNPTSEKPRNLEVAVANVKYEELKNNYEIAKIRFDENPLFQLKALTAFLSSKLVVDQNKIVFTGKCLEHPLGMFPDKHRHFIHSVFNEVGKEVRYQFFDTCLLALVSDMKQGNPISGYKVMLQSLVSHYPEVVYENFDLISDLIQGYTSPNKITISTTIMWVIAQAGNYNFKHGLQVWRTFMLSFIEQKNYTRYSLDYLKHLFTRHHIKRDALSIPEYLEYVDLLFQGYVIPKACVTELQSSCKLFRERTSLEDAGKYFLMVLEERIPQPGSALYRQETVAFLYSLLREDPHACFTQWRNVYVNNLPESVLLLRLIYKDWKKIQSDGILPYKETKYTIETFHLINQSMYKKKIHCEGLDECNRIIETRKISTAETCNKEEDVPEDIQKELIELQNDTNLKESYRARTFGAAKAVNYTIIRRAALRHLMLFSTTYLSERGFSTLLIIKTLKQNTETTWIASDDMRLALANTIKPRISQLVKDMRKSH
ncbi:hypothetical protein M8J77_002251 [Diaphorina citri]|nr:hypothetical protein M8J77_002251 [Diaphorina citri]